MTTDKGSRRDFLKTTAAVGTAAMAANLSLLGNAHAQGNEVIRVGLVGCGGRGTGAATDCLHAAPNLRLVAMGDAFRDRAAGSRQRLMNDNAVRAKVDVPDERIFTGLNAYQDVIRNCDLVILATPPGFRAMMLQAAVAARKHVFTEKPVCVDGPTFRTCMRVFEQAQRDRLSIVAGTQRRYQTSYLESMQRIKDGAIGNVVAGRCYWNQGRLWSRAREEGWSDVEWQIRNWLYFTWLSGDHIVEQHVHNLDVINWALGDRHPIKCVGLGGRQVRTAPEFGHIFDHHALDLEYPDGVHVLSMCRQIQGCANNVSEAVVGTRGSWTSQGHRITGENAWSFGRGRDNQPYRAEHVALIRAITTGTPINDLKRVAEASMTAVLGRMATYTGQEVTWEQATTSEQSLVPENLTMETRMPVPPVAMPGTTTLS